MATTSYENITFAREVEDNIDNAAEQLENPTVVRALRICDKIVGDDKSMVELYGCVGSLFDDNLDIKEVIVEAKRSKLHIVLEYFEDVYMKCLANKDKNFGIFHYISFNAKYLPRLSTPAQQNRCTFLHVVKFLDEVSSTLSSSYAGRTAAYEQGTHNLSTPGILGGVWRERGTKGSDGSVWEVLVFGGTVLTGGTNAKPFSKPLLLKVTDNPMGAPGYTNSKFLSIGDAEVERLLMALERWTVGEPLPELTIATSPEQEEEGDPSLPAAKRHRKNVLGYGGMSQGASSSPVGAIRSNLPASLDIDADDQGHGGAGVLSEEEYTKLVRQGQAMSAEQEKAWLTGKVKF